MLKNFFWKFILNVIFNKNLLNSYYFLYIIYLNMKIINNLDNFFFLLFIQ